MTKANDFDNIKDHFENIARELGRLEAEHGIPWANALMLMNGLMARQSMQQSTQVTLDGHKVN